MGGGGPGAEQGVSVLLVPLPSTIARESLANSKQGKPLLSIPKGTTRKRGGGGMVSVARRVPCLAAVARENLAKVRKARQNPCVARSKTKPC